MDGAIEIIRSNNRKRIENALQDERIMQFNKDRRNEYELASKKGGGQANWRLVASYPMEVRALIIAKYGPQALKDDKFYKEFLKSDNMQPFLAVPTKEI